MKKLNIHVLMHVAYEGIACIESWIQLHQHSVSFTKLYESVNFPESDEYDWLIVMGGPMSVTDEQKFSWLVTEKKFILDSIESGKTVIGICLGSQLIAEMLGARVYPNLQKEIGWFDLELTQEAKKIEIFKLFEDKFKVFHWHGDTFDLARNCIRLFHSEVTKNQAFIYNDKVLGLQFHLEVTSNSLIEMIENGKEELIETKSVQTASEILKYSEHIALNNQKMFHILDYLESK